MSDLTIRDIAKIAGVSDATRQHVQEVIARTGFTPNVHTRRLNLGRSFSVHVVLYWHEHDLFNQFALIIRHLFHFQIPPTFVSNEYDVNSKNVFSS